MESMPPGPILWLSDPVSDKDANTLFVDHPLMTVSISPDGGKSFDIDRETGMTRNDFSAEDAGLAGFFLAYEAISTSVGNATFAGKKSTLRPIGPRATTGRHREYAKHLLPRLQSARVLSYSPESFLVMHDLADRWLCQDAGVQFGVLPDAPDVRKEESERLLDHTIAVCKHRPLTQKLPFDHVWVGYGHGIPLSPLKKLAKVLSFDEDGSRAASQDIWILGHLISRDGFVHEFVFVTAPEETGIFFYPRRIPGEMARTVISVGPDTGPIPPSENAHEWTWLESYDLLPLILEGLLGELENCGSTIEKNRRSRLKSDLQWKKSVKGFGRNPGRTPPPFYTIDLTRRTLQERTEKGFEVRTRGGLTYQHDRWGHERVRVTRGAQPMDQETLRKFQQRAQRNKGQVRIFIEENLDNETRQRLSDRGIPPKRPDEWMVVTTTWIEDMRVPAKPPPGMPYIPAVRKTTGATR